MHYLVGSRAGLAVDPLSPRRLRALIPGLHRHDIYVCGPPGMMRSVIAPMRAAGVPRRRIHHETFEL